MHWIYSVNYSSSKSAPDEIVLIYLQILIINLFTRRGQSMTKSAMICLEASNMSDQISIASHNVWPMCSVIDVLTNICQSFNDIFFYLISFAYFFSYLIFR